MWSRGQRVQSFTLNNDAAVTHLILLCTFYMPKHTHWHTLSPLCLVCVNYQEGPGLASQGQPLSCKECVKRAHIKKKKEKKHLIGGRGNSATDLNKLSAILKCGLGKCKYWTETKYWLLLCLKRSISWTYCKQWGFLCKGGKTVTWLSFLRQKTFTQEIKCRYYFVFKKLEKKSVSVSCHYILVLNHYEFIYIYI